MSSENHIYRAVYKIYEDRNNRKPASSSERTELLSNLAENKCEYGVQQVQDTAYCLLWLKNYLSHAKLVGVFVVIFVLLLLNI